MHPGKINSIRSNIEHLVAQYRATEDGNQGLFGINDREFDKIIDQLYKVSSIAEKFSEKYLKRKIREVVIDIATRSEKLDEEVDAFIAQLEAYETEYTVFLPLSGIEVESSDREYRLGNICIVESTSELQAEVKKALRDILSRNPLYSNQQKEDHFKMSSPVIEECFNAPAMARHSVIAEPIRAREHAEKETRRVLEVIRFYSMVVEEFRWNMKVCLMHESNPRVRHIVGYSDERFTHSESVSGPIKNFLLSDDSIKRIRESGANKFLELISEPITELTEFEKSLLQALRWLATSQMQYDNETRLLNLISALEALLTRDINFSIANSIAEGAAILLGEDLQEKISIRDDIKSYYGERSRLSHGESKTVSDTDLERVRHYVVSLLLILIERRAEFDTQADLFSWIDRQKLS
jgi:hypothetical protein